MTAHIAKQQKQQHCQIRFVMCSKVELNNVTAFHLYRAPSLCFLSSVAVVMVWCGGVVVVVVWCGGGGGGGVVVVVWWWWCGVGRVV